MGREAARPWAILQQALDTHFPNEKPRLLVLDDYQAKYLEAQLSGYKVEGIYSYLSRTAGLAIASALDIYEVFHKALQNLLPSEANLSFLEGWEYAKNFSEDIREILLSLSPHEKPGAYREPLLSVWQEVATEKALQDLFALSEKDDDIPWVRLLQLPRTYQGPTIKLLYKHIATLAVDFLEGLCEKRQALGEELFMKNKLPELVVFWNIFSPEKRIHQWMQYWVAEGRAKVWGWDVRPLQECIGAPIWPPGEATHHSFTSALTLHEAFSPWEEREVHLRRHFRTRTELLEAAAVKIVEAYRAGEMVGVWIGDATVKPLLEDLLRREGFTGPPLTHPTLSQTRIGHFLRQAYQRGFMPSLDSLPAWEASEDAEMAAYHLYYLFLRSGEAQGQTLTAFMHFLRFLERLPSPVGWPVLSTQFLSGSLAQLAGLAYEKLFILLPSKEPLGPWFRPSFLPAPLRRRYYPPIYRTHTTWRLLTLLLYGSRQTYLYQLAGEENHSPLEEFLTYFPKKHPSLNRLWLFREPRVSSPSPQTRASSEALPLPFPQALPLRVPTVISPSELYEFLECPRRYYLRRIVRIPGGASSVQAFLGTWLHIALSTALIGPPPHLKRPRSSPKALLIPNLSTLERLWSPRRLYRVLRSTYYLAQREAALRLPPLSQNPEMRFWQRLWAESGRLFFQHLSGTCSPPLGTSRLRLYPEVWISASIAPHHEPTLTGRLDLLITTDQNTPLLALDYKTGALPQSLGELAGFRATWEKTLHRISQGHGPDKDTVRSIDFQAFTYAMNFSDNFVLIVANAFNERNYVTYKLSKTERLEVWQLWQSSFELLTSRHRALGRILSGDNEAVRRQEVEALFPMTTEETPCRYCPYKLLCQRL